MQNYYFFIIAEVDINFLMQKALSSISSLPFHLVQDTWRWKLFSGQFPEQEWNKAYWMEKFLLN